MDSDSRSKRQSKRRLEILGATLRLLRKHGAGITTAQIAQEASCSKETLYSWFGDRDGIMLALVQEQTASMNAVLEAGFAKAEGDLEARLKKVSTLLLDLLTGEASMAVNRVAMAQACRERSDFGEALLEQWESQVAAPFLALFEEGADILSIDDPEEAFQNLIGLLVGDRQRQLLLGADSRPDPAGMATVAGEAVDKWLSIYKA